MHPARVALVVLMLMATTCACGNAVEDPGPAAGAAGVSVTAEGHVVINAYVCRDVINEIQVVGDREGLEETAENKIIQTYRSDKSLKGASTLDLADPGDGWSPNTPLELQAGKGYIISAQGEGDEGNETYPIYLSTDRIAELKPGSVYTSDSSDPDSTTLTPHTAAEFKTMAKTACAD